MTGLNSDQTHLVEKINDPQYPGDHSLRHRLSRSMKNQKKNYMISSENLPVLRCLSRSFPESVQFVYLDPPYNTGNQFAHYSDQLSHQSWLKFMECRLELIKPVIRPDGFISVQIDDHEGPYLKVLMDKIFGRENYLTTFYIQVRYQQKQLKRDMAFHKQIEQILIYRKSPVAVPNQIKRSKSLEKYCYYVDEKVRGKQIRLGGKSVEIFSPEQFQLYQDQPGPKGRKEIWASGTILEGNSSGRFFRDFLSGRCETDGLGVLYKVYGIGRDNHNFRYFLGPRRAGATKGRYLQGVPAEQIENPGATFPEPVENFYDLSAAFGNCRHEGGVGFRGGKKPEKLLELLIRTFSASGDRILDAFGGSGTTAAVAHKMKRVWTLIESGPQCETHMKKRLELVCKGLDATGISEQYRWKGGGDFKFIRLRQTSPSHENR